MKRDELSFAYARVWYRSKTNRFHGIRSSFHETDRDELCVVIPLARQQQILSPAFANFSPPGSVSPS